MLKRTILYVKLDNINDFFGRIFDQLVKGRFVFWNTCVG